MCLGKIVKSEMIAILVFCLFSVAVATPTTITAPPVADNLIPHEPELKDVLGECLHRKNVSKCLKTRLIHAIDDVIENNDPLSLKLFNVNMSLNKDPKFHFSHAVDESRSFEDVVSQKLKSLLESRVIQIKLSDETDANEARKKKGGGGKHGMMMGGKRILVAVCRFELNVL